MNLHPDIHGDVSHIPQLGTPGEERRRKQARLERLYHRAFLVGAALILILLVLYGYGSHEEKLTAGIAYREKAARLAEGRMACELEPHEGCLVCLHREARGVLISAHC